MKFYNFTIATSFMYNREHLQIHDFVLYNCGRTSNPLENEKKRKTTNYQKALS